MTKQAFNELQQEWYQKAADSGFKDIESPSGKSVTRLPAVVLTSVHCNTVTNSLHDTENAQYWRAVGRAAAELSPDHSHYILYNAFADSGCFTEAAKEAGISYNKAAFQIRKWLDSLNLTSRPGGKRKRKVTGDGS
jgi:hypothetical protein